MIIETFVFFDIETTGLPQFEKNRTKITEIALLAASRRDIETCINLPIVNKLNYVFNPEKKIQTKAAEMTGLTNAMLKNQPVFKNRTYSLNSFFEELPKPVCLVAHNGNRFDYKILKAEYEDAGRVLPNDLLCVDSLIGFKKILSDNVSLNIKTPDISAFEDELLTDDEDWPELNTSTEEWEEIDRLTESFSKVLSNTDKMIKKKDVVKKEKISYKLTELYKRFYNKHPSESHRAEADCILLLQCVVAKREHFLPWADKNCQLLSKINPLLRK